MRGYYQQLVNGLDNYRHRGYQIALKFDGFAQGDQVLDLIAKLSPNYVSFSARNLERVQENTILEKLQQLKTGVEQAGGQSILQQIDEKRFDLLARNIGFDLVEGGYYRAIAFDYLSNEKSDGAHLNALIG